MAASLPSVLASAADRMEVYFPNVALTTHGNKKVRFYDDMVKGKVVLFNLMYTNCEGICPQICVRTEWRINDSFGCTTLAADVPSADCLSQPCIVAVY